MTQHQAGSEDGERFREFLWSFLDHANRRRLLKFDGQTDPWSSMSMLDKLNLAAAAQEIAFLCSELEDPGEGFEAVLARLQNAETLPPKIAYFEGYAGASIAVTCLAAFNLYGEADEIGSWRRAATLLLNRLA